MRRSSMPTQTSPHFTFMDNLHARRPVGIFLILFFLTISAAHRKAVTQNAYKDTSNAGPHFKRTAVDTAGKERE